METKVDDTLRAEASRYLLRFGCEHCAHFDGESGRCAEGFPNEPHRDVRLEQRRAILFCKSFELG